MRRQSEYWKKYLSNSTPCLFPSLTTTPSSSPSPPTSTSTTRTPIPLALTHDTHLRRFCAHHAVTPLTVFQLTWAICLAHSLSTPDIIFGYRENAIFDDTLVVEEESIYRLRFPLDTTIPNLLHRNNTRSPRHRAFQTGSVPATLRLAGYRNQRLFNTFLYVEPSTGNGLGATGSEDLFSYETMETTQLDPIMRRYDLVVKMSVADDEQALSMGEILCADALMSPEQTRRLAGMFAQVLDAVLLSGYASSPAGDGDESPDELEGELGLDRGLLGLSPSGMMGTMKSAAAGEESLAVQKRVLAARGMGWDNADVRYQAWQGMSV